MGALIEHGGWRQSLYQRRLGLKEQWSILEWVESGVSQFALSLGWGRLSLQLSGAGVRSVEEIQSRVAMSRQLVIAGQMYELTITPQNEENQHGTLSCVTLLWEPRFLAVLNFDS